MHSSPPDHRPVPDVLGTQRPLVGRDVELGLLQNAYARTVRHGTCHVVNLIGEVGIGKSRILDELNGWLHRQSGRPVVLRGRAAAEGRAMPRSGMRSLVAERLEIRDDDVGGAVAAKLRAGLGALSGAQAEIVGHWLGFDLGDCPAVRDLAGNPEFGTIALGHLTAHFTWLLERAPLVLLLEDLQWSDPESLDLVGHVVDAFRDAPVVVVCATRPSLFEQRPHWSAGPGEVTTTIELSPLDDERCRQLVHGLLRDADGQAPLVDAVVAASRGIPLLAEQLVGLLVDEGVIVVDRGEPWRVDPERIITMSMPGSLAEVVRARLDALPADESAVVRHASIIGRTFWDDAVVAAAVASGSGPSTHPGVSSALTRLAARGFVLPRGWSAFTGCAEHSFRHAELGAIAATTVTQTDQAAVHGLAARWLELHTGGRVGEHAAVLAEHLVHAGDLGRAADLLHEAGARAGATAAWQSAIDFYRRSLECRAETGTSHDIASTSTRIELADLLASVGQNDEAAAMYHTAETDATRSSSHRLAASAMAGALRTAASRGRWEESEQLARRVQPLAERFGGATLGRFLAARALLFIDGPQQDMEAAQRLTEQSLGIWRELEDPASELRALNQLGFMNSKAGRSADAQRWFAEGLALARRVGDTSGEWMLLQNQAVLAHREARAGRADYAQVLELYRSSLDRRRRLGLPYVLSLANLAQAEVESGRVDEGRRHADEALRLGWLRHDPLDWTIALITLAQVAIAAGRLAEGLGMLGALLSERGTPALEREIAAVLDVHGLDHDAATARMDGIDEDLTAVVERLLADQA